MAERANSDGPAKGECWSIDDENYNAHSLGELLDSHDYLKVGQDVFVADAIPATPETLVDADDIVEMFAERAYDEYGECAQDWPEVTEEAKVELDALLQAWAEKHCKALFWRVENSRAYTLTADDLSGHTVLAATNDGSVGS